VRALDASGALAVNSDLLSWFLAVERKCQHPILGHSASFELLAHRASLPPTPSSHADDKRVCSLLARQTTTGKGLQSAIRARDVRAAGLQEEPTNAWTELTLRR
jgi:hypothetical protein